MVAGPVLVHVLVSEAQSDLKHDQSAGTFVLAVIDFLGHDFGVLMETLDTAADELSQWDNVGHGLTSTSDDDGV